MICMRLHLYVIIALVSLHQWLLVHVIGSLLEGRLENVLLIFSFEGLAHLWQLSVLQKSNRWSHLTLHPPKRRPCEREAVGLYDPSHASALTSAAMMNC